MQELLEQLVGQLLDQAPRLGHAAPLQGKLVRGLVRGRGRGRLRLRGRRPGAEAPNALPLRPVGDLGAVIIFGILTFFYSGAVSSSTASSAA